MDGGAAVVLVNVDLGHAQLPGWFSLHPDLAQAKHFVLGQQLWNPQQIQWYCVSIFRRCVLRATENGGSVVFCCFSWALLSGTWPHFSLTISNWLQNHLWISPEPSQTYSLHPPTTELQVHCLTSWTEINPGLRHCSNMVFYSWRG